MEDVRAMVDDICREIARSVAVPRVYRVDPVTHDLVYDYVFDEPLLVVDLQALT